MDGVYLGRARLADVPQACLQSRAHDVGVWARRALPLLRVCLLDPPQHRPSLHSSVSISRLRVDYTVTVIIVDILLQLKMSKFNKN